MHFLEELDDMYYCSVVISSYNYAEYVGQAIDSVLSQTYKNFELIVVDDGSTDSSIEVINRYIHLNNFKVVRKTNGGQLSVFNRAIQELSGDLVFFLDADDMYEADYIERSVNFYIENQKCDFLFCKMRLFGNVEGFTEDFNHPVLGHSMLSTFYLRKWIGSPTSAISMKSSILKQILPIPFEKDWIIRADDCLVWGASLVAARKYYFDKPMVKYRVHEANNFYNTKSYSIDYCLARELAIQRLFHSIKQKNCCYFSQNLLLMEYISIPKKGILDIIDYSKIAIKMDFGFFRTCKILLKLLMRYRSSTDGILC